MRETITYRYIDYVIEERKDNRIQISSIRPYDLQEYHYAIQNTQDEWIICRNGERINYIWGKTYQDIIEQIYEYDKDLTSKIDKS